MADESNFKSHSNANDLSLSTPKTSPFRRRAVIPVHSDVIKVQHVLQVLCGRPSDHQAVLALFERFNMEISGLFVFRNRWFVCLPSAEWALYAVNVVREEHFKLSRVDTNINFVEMLKDIVPPPSKPGSRPLINLVRSYPLLCTLSVHDPRKQQRL